MRRKEGRSAVEDSARASQEETCSAIQGSTWASSNGTCWALNGLHWRILIKGQRLRRKLPFSGLEGTEGFPCPQRCTANLHFFNKKSQGRHKADLGTPLNSLHQSNGKAAKLRLARHYLQYSCFKHKGLQVFEPTDWWYDELSLRGMIQALLCMVTASSKQCTRLMVCLLYCLESARETTDATG